VKHMWIAYIYNPWNFTSGIHLVSIPRAHVTSFRCVLKYVAI